MHSVTSTEVLCCSTHRDFKLTISQIAAGSFATSYCLCGGHRSSHHASWTVPQHLCKAAVWELSLCSALRYLPSLQSCGKSSHLFHFEANSDRTREKCHMAGNTGVGSRGWWLDLCSFPSFCSWSHTSTQAGSHELCSEPFSLCCQRLGCGFTGASTVCESWLTLLGLIEWDWKVTRNFLIIETALSSTRATVYGGVFKFLLEIFTLSTRKTVEGIKYLFGSKENCPQNPHKNGCGTPL